MKTFTQRTLFTALLALCLLPLLAAAEKKHARDEANTWGGVDSNDDTESRPVQRARGAEAPGVVEAPVVVAMPIVPVIVPQIVLVAVEAPRGPVIIPVDDPEAAPVVAPTTWAAMSPESRRLQQRFGQKPKNWLKKMDVRQRSIDRPFDRSAVLIEKREQWVNENISTAAEQRTILDGTAQLAITYLALRPQLAITVEELNYSSPLGIYPSADIMQLEVDTRVFCNLKSLTFGWSFSSMPPVFLALPNLKKMTLEQCVDGNTLPKDFPPGLEELELKAFNFVEMTAEGHPELPAQASQINAPMLRELRLPNCTMPIAFLDSLPASLELLDLRMTVKPLSTEERMRRVRFAPPITEADVAYLQARNPFLRILLPPLPVAPPVASRAINPYIGRRLQFG